MKGVDRTGAENRPERANLTSIRVPGTNYNGRIMKEMGVVRESGTRVEQVVGGRGWRYSWAWKKDGKKLSGQVRRDSSS